MDEISVDTAREFEISDLCWAVADGSPMPMVGVEGPAHIIRYVNKAYRDLTGKSAEQLMGQSFAQAVPAGNKCLSLLERVYLSGKAEGITGQEEPASHRLYWSYAMWPILAEDHRDVGIMIQVTETTPFVQQATAMNQALLISSMRQHELTETADHLNAELEARILDQRRTEQELRLANNDLEQFAYSASHDLQEPLRTITYLGQLLKRSLPTPLDPELDQLFDSIMDANGRMSALISDLLEFSRVGVADQRTREQMECDSAFRAAVASLNSRIEDTHALITSDPLPTIKADLPQLTRLFQNLIGNALKYRNGTPEIHVTAVARGHEWLFSVRDNGIGFDPQYAERIFGVFKRLHGKEYPGTGIGLAICKRIVERHHGTIWATSEPGEGSTFFFTLPQHLNSL